MKCRQARKGFEELLDGEKSLQSFPSLKAHLEECPQCQAWYTQERRVVHALEQLDRFPVPSDFTKRVLSRLPDRVPLRRPSPAARVELALDRMHAAWGSLLSSLGHPARRRRWVPALVLVASLLLVVGLWAGLQGGAVSSTPGAAVGASPWVIGVGVVLAAVVLVVGLFLWLRKG
jgi:predicted anti-sigma-YlaC factor YlaD